MLPSAANGQKLHDTISKIIYCPMNLKNLFSQQGLKNKFYGNIMETIGKQKSCNEYSCVLCDYTTSRKSSFSKHVLSLKHKKVATGLPKVANRCNQTLFTCDYCEKQFNHRSGLWKHKKHCGIDAISHSIHCANQIRCGCKCRWRTWHQANPGEWRKGQWLIWLSTYRIS